MLAVVKFDLYLDIKARAYTIDQSESALKTNLSLYPQDGTK